MSVTLKGQKALERQIKKFSEPEKLFDKDFKKIQREGLRELKKDTIGKGKIKTGNTARGWLSKKLNNSRYLVFNLIKTKNRKHLIVNILNKGRGVIRPKRAKKLYIPLTNKGAARSKNAVWGKDFVLVKKAKAVKGLEFIEKEEKRAGIALTRALIATIRET